MKKIFEKSLALMLCIFISGAGLSYAEFENLKISSGYFQNISDSVLKEKTEKSKEYILNLIKKDFKNASSWMIIGLSRYDRNSVDGIDKKYKNSIEKKLMQNNKVLSKRKYTEYSREILALTSLGYDAKDISGCNLVKNLSDYDKVSFQGINGNIWAIIALDSNGYEIEPLDVKAVQNSRKYMINDILNRQLKDGGFALNAKSENDKADPDITAMAIVALSKYMDDKNVKDAVKKAVDCLSNLQEKDGGYTSYSNETSESASQVITALTSIGIDPAKDQRFIKNKNSLLDNLLSYQNPDGSFRHLKTDKNPNIMSTEQGFYALVAYDRFCKNKTHLYDMKDLNIKKHEKKSNFKDIQNSKYRDKIEDLYQKNIISGVSKQKFAPNEKLTRAQFAVMISKALDLKPKGKMNFGDVEKNIWYYDYVLSCSGNKIINGTSKESFSPDKKITRQEACVIIKNCAKYMKKSMKYKADILEKISDSKDISPWAREAVAYCLDKKALDAEFSKADPEKFLDRQEAANMIYFLLNQDGKNEDK